MIEGKTFCPHRLESRLIKLILLDGHVLVVTDVFCARKWSNRMIQQPDGSIRPYQAVIAPCTVTWLYALRHRLGFTFSSQRLLLTALILWLRVIVSVDILYLMQISRCQASYSSIEFKIWAVSIINLLNFKLYMEN